MENKTFSGLKLMPGINNENVFKFHKFIIKYNNINNGMNFDNFSIFAPFFMLISLNCTIIQPSNRRGIQIQIKFIL